LIRPWTSYSEGWSFNIIANIMIYHVVIYESLFVTHVNRTNEIQSRSNDLVMLYKRDKMPFKRHG